MSKSKFQAFDDIIKEMICVYQHDERPWLIGYSGGKDSTMLVSLVFQAVAKIPEGLRNKKVYIITSDTMAENPIVKDYMHESSQKIQEASEQQNLNIEARIIYPEPGQTFWSRVIGLGYPTPEPPGFRWCTERLKINPMNKFVDDCIKTNGEIIILLGVRKAESIARSRSISKKKIEGYLLNPHNNINNAYVYNPLTDIENGIVWEYLLRGDSLSPWGTNMKQLYSLYQGENLSEEQSVLGEVDEKKLPVTGNSRFGCWCCTIVKEDKSLQSFINKNTNGSDKLIRLRDFRNWLVGIRQNPEFRDTKRRNGTVYTRGNGEVGFGPFTLDARRKILKKLLELQHETELELITTQELKSIDEMWDNDGDLERRHLVDIYFEVMGKHLPWDQYKTPMFHNEIVEEIRQIANQHNIEPELMEKLIVSVDKNKHFTRSNAIKKEVTKIINQEWLHQDILPEEM
ncbi:MAG: DNA phosphorothioation system sulfurtransferase DndC [Christensenellaceae bacterium]